MKNSQGVLVSEVMIKHHNSLRILHKDNRISDLTRQLNKLKMALAASDQRIEMMLRDKVVESINV